MKRKDGEIYGAVIGDICGSAYEGGGGKTNKPETIDLMRPDCKFTDDTVLTAAINAAVQVAHCPQIVDGERVAYRCDEIVYPYGKVMQMVARAYPGAGYGGNFCNWMLSPTLRPYNSYGNGSAMRVSPIGWLFLTEEEVLKEAKLSAMPTHNHPEGVKGAQSVALAIFMLKNGATKTEVKERIEKEFGYDLSRTLEEIRPNYYFEVSCQKSVPESFIAFFESHDFASALQNAISLGGDTDTMAAIAGSLAQSHYDEVPEELINFVKQKMAETGETGRLERMVMLYTEYASLSHGLIISHYLQKLCPDFETDETTRSFAAGRRAYYENYN